MQDVIKALKLNAEVLEKNATFYAEHVPPDIHQIPELRLKGAILRDVAHGYRETALQLEKSSHG
jgi:hypothetical protein